MKYTLNLSTRSYVNRRTLYLSYAVLGGLLLVVLLLNVLRFYSLTTEIGDTDDRITAIQAEILARSGVEGAAYDDASYQRLLDDIARSNEILQRDSFRWTGLLDQLEKLVPHAVRIVRIDPDHEERSIHLSGQAKDLDALKRFIDNLIRSGVYRSVLLDNQATEAKTGLINFTLALEGAF